MDKTFNVAYRPVPGGGKCAGSIDFISYGFLISPMYLVFGMGLQRFWKFGHCYFFMHLSGVVKMRFCSLYGKV